MATDRHDIEEIVRIVRLEYQRCMEGCGQTPTPEDYRAAIEHWLLEGETPQEWEAKELGCCGKGPYAD